MSQNSHFDSFTHFAKNTIILAQEEMKKLGESTNSNPASYYWEFYASLKA